MVPNTIVGAFPTLSCWDCNGKPVIYKHYGQFVPSGMTGYFCLECWKTRKEYHEKHGEPKPLKDITDFVDEAFGTKEQQAERLRRLDSPEPSGAEGVCESTGKSFPLADLGPNKAICPICEGTDWCPKGEDHVDPVPDNES